MAAIHAPAGDHSRRQGPFYTQLYFQVLFAIFLGGLIGALVPTFRYEHVIDPATQQMVERADPIPENAWVRDFLNPLGLAFVKLVKMIVAPVIFLTIVIGIANMRDLGKLGRVVFKALAYFLFFSTLALIVRLIVGNLVQPGAGMNVDPASLTDPPS